MILHNKKQRNQETNHSYSTISGGELNIQQTTNAIAIRQSQTISRRTRTATQVTTQI